MRCEIPFHRPSLSDKERTYLLQALEEAYWGGGKWVAKLEEHLSALFGREAVVVSSGTAALHLALHLLLEKKSGEVILPTWTFTATASEVIHAGGIPVLADVSSSLHLYAATIEERLSPHTRGIIVMHYAGAPAPMDEIIALKERYGLFLIEDACHALGSQYQGQLCGTFGDIAVFSLHATKPVAAGQGGFLLIADPALAEKARRLRQHGIQRTLHTPWDYEIIEPGWNYMLSDFQAAVALAQLERLEELRRRREALAHLYIQHFQTHPALQLYPFPSSEKLSWHLFPLFWEEGSAQRRTLLYQKLRAQGFHLSLHYKPLHLHPAYQPYVQPHHRFPIADRAYERILTLPLWPDLSPVCAHRLASSLLQALTPATPTPLLS